MSNIRRVSMAFLGFALLLLIAGWLLLHSALFREMRVTVLSNQLTGILGRTVIIDGDVQLSTSPSFALVATGVRLPAEEFPDLDLAKLDLARFPVSIGNWFRGGIYLPEIEARGLTVFLIQSEDGVATWIKPGPEREREARPESAAGQPDLIAFLGQREIIFADMRVRAENHMTGFEFDFELEKFTIEQGQPGKDNIVQVRSGGKINGQPITFSGGFPDDAPFEAEGRLGALIFTIDGEKPPGAARGDFDGRLNLEIADTQSLLDLLKLEGKFAAEAKAGVTLVRRNTHLDMKDIDLRASLATGEKTHLTGSFADARFGYDFDLSLLVDFVGENTPPPPAIFLKDMKVKTAEIHVLAQNGDIEIDRFALETNAFDEEIRDIGPFRVESVTRSDTGQLQLDGATLVIGPQDRPYLLAQGSVDNLLSLEGYRVSGALDLPAQRVLLTLRPEEADRFGRLVGQMKLRETDGEPDLELLELRSQDTDLWYADINLKSADLDSFDDLELYAKITTPDGKELLNAMRLDPVDIGFMGYEITATRKKNEVLSEALLYAGETEIKADVSLRIPGTGPVLRGEIQSEEVQIDDVRNKIRVLIQLARLKSIYAESRNLADDSIDDGFQPLVLADEAPQAEEDLSDFQMLVLPDPNPDLAEQEDLTEFQPLVVSDNLTDLAIEDVLDPKQFARLIDAEIGINIARITGQEGVSTLNSQFQMKSGDLRLGPVKLFYGKGYADVTATMDAIDAPDWLRVTGQTGGWDFGNILNALGADIGAYGTLNGTFDLTGHKASAKEFVSSMHGKATIDMRDGRLSTGLIELAGLGVLPWLFSQERRQGYSDVVCLKSVLDIANGRIETRETVLETQRVQLVGSGMIDVPGDTISFAVEPRPIGQPLSRSAWPIEVSGSLKSPDVKVAKRKSRRALVPLSMLGTRAPCVPDIAQLQQTDDPGQ